MNGPLLHFGREIWVVDGPVTSFHGFPYPTRMAVIRLSDGGLFIWSPIALTESLRASVAPGAGPVRHLVYLMPCITCFSRNGRSHFPSGSPPRTRRDCGASART